MNKLKIIFNALRIFKFLAVAGAVFALLFFFFIPDRPVSLGGQYWRIDDAELTKQMNEMLPTNEEISFEIQANLIAPMTPSLRLMICTFVIIVSGFFFYLLHLAQKVVSDIRSGQTFTLQNINRIKTIGVLIALSMFGEKFLSGIGDYWFTNSYEFKGLTMVSETQLGWYIVILGAIIYALGVAFEQGLKIQEEQELTI